MRNMINFLTYIIHNYKIIFELAKKDFEKRYLGSFLGILWAFIQPTISIFIYWFVFEIGFKSQPVQDFPFVLWLMCGLIPWFFFSESLGSATYAILENSFLVKKVVFRVSILPLVKILSNLFVHLFFIIFLIIIFGIYGYKPNLYNLQLIYYSFALLVLLIGLSWISSALIVFMRDIGQLVAMILQFGFWMTPIFWHIKMVPEKYIYLIKINPLYYIVQGYRESLIDYIWFWMHPVHMIYFWVVNLFILILGACIFRKLRRHFADVI